RAGDLVGDHLARPGEPRGGQRKTIRPDDLVTAEKDELDEQRMAVALITKPCFEDVADLVALVGGGSVGLERNLRSGMRGDDRDRAQGAQSDRDVLDQRFGKTRRSPRGE